MYKIYENNQDNVQWFYSQYRQRIIDAIDFYLNGGSTNFTFSDKNKTRISLKLDATSYTSKFLNDLKSGLLEKLICGTSEELKAILYKVYDENQTCFTKLNVSKLRKVYPEKRLGTFTYLDDFHAITYDIFVTRLYESELNKTEFVKKLDLKICPYCGINFIPVLRKGNYNIKPEIDHFFPKSDFPILAFSFYNLIPCCHDCNHKFLKGDNPPINMDNNELYLMNPYKFETEKLRFEIGSKNYNYFNEEDYWVDLKCDGNFNKGYNEYLGLTIRYSVHKYIIKDLLVLYLGYNKDSMDFYNGLNIPDDFRDLYIKTLFGYQSSENDGLVPLAKFKRDIYSFINQLLNS
ncbi:hypothetical protein AAH082_04430 [Phocaeicola vulgatus]|jgi:hypothetical protein|uniref:HNH endonuclease n=1 Tax=Bacteroidaceae TaxID=815 RepID=UPI0025C72D17|nr:hypothetical protein [Bacteroides sp.]MBS6239520.1 hypothetical protein [Bacteroides sp.]